MAANKQRNFWSTQRPGIYLFRTVAALILFVSAALPFFLHRGGYIEFAVIVIVLTAFVLLMNRWRITNDESRSRSSQVIEDPSITQAGFAKQMKRTGFEKPAEPPR